MAVASFEVGALFRIEDDATPALQRLGEQFTRLDEQITTIQERLETLGKGENLFSGITAGLERLGDLFEAVEAKATQMGEAMEAAFRRGADAATAAARQVDELAAAMGRAASAATGARGGAVAPGGGFARGGEAEFDEGDYFRPPGARRGTTFVPTFGGGQPRIPGGPGFIEGEFEEIPQLRLGYSGGGGFGGFSGGGGGPRGAPPWSPYSASGFPGYGGGAGGSIHGGSPFQPPPYDGMPPLALPPGYGGGGYTGGHGGYMAPLIEGAAVYEAMKAASSEEQSIAITLLRGFGIDPSKTDAKTEAMKQQLRNLAAGAAAGTSFSEREVSAGMFELAAPLGFRGEEGLKKFGDIFEPAAKAAEAAKQLHFGTYEGSLVGAVELAHMLQDYTPGGVTKGMNLLGAVTESVPHGDMLREAKIMSYVVPQARALGADPEETMIATGFLQRAGLNSTVASTTLRQMLVGLLKSGGPLGSHLTHVVDHEARELEDSLHLKPGRMAGGRTKAEHDKHVQALKDLHLMDAAGHLTTLYTAADEKAGLGKAGGVNMLQMFEMMAQAQARLNPHDFGQAMFNAFGIRGQTGGELLGEALPLYKQYAATIRGTLPLDQQLAMVNTTTSQQTGQAVARVADLGNQLAQPLLPILQDIDKNIIDMATGLKGWAQEHPVAAATGTLGFLGASAYAGWLGIKGMAGKFGHLFAEGSAHNVQEAGQAAVGRGFGGLGTGIFGTVMTGVSALLLANEVQKKTDEILKEHEGKNDPQSRLLRLMYGGMDLTGPHARPGPRPENLPGAQQPQPPSAPPKVDIHLGPVNMNGVADASTFDGLLHKLTSALKDALSHATGAAQGTGASPYTFNGVP